MSGAIARQRGLERVHLLVLPALGAVDDDEAAADRERHRVQRGGDVVRRRLVALEQLDALHAALLLGELAQARAALGDATVVVAVDQIGGFEGGRHRACESRTVSGRSLALA